MMRLLMLQHVPREHTSSINDWVRERGHHAVTLPMWEVSDLVDPTGYDAVIILGGTMNVHDDFSFLAYERDFIRAYHREVPMLGVCLGAQLIAHVLGATIEENSRGQEVGFGKIELTQAGKQHPLFSGFDSTLEVFQWHGYTFALPKGSELLATSEICANQAFTHGISVGVQFHFEVTPQLGREVYAEGGAWARSHPDFSESDFMRDLDEKADLMRQQCFRLLDNFVSYT